MEKLDGIYSEVRGSFWIRLDAVCGEVGFRLLMRLNVIGGEVGCSFVERLNVIQIRKAITEVGSAMNRAPFEFTN